MTWMRVTGKNPDTSYGRAPTIHAGRDNKTRCGKNITPGWNFLGEVGPRPLEAGALTCEKCRDSFRIDRANKLVEDPLHGNIGRGDSVTDRRWRGYRGFMRTTVRPG